MLELNYSKKEIEIGMKDSENLLRSLIAMIHNKVVVEKGEFDVEKYIEVDIENILGLLEKTASINNDDDKINRVRCLLDFLSNIEITDKKGEKFKAVTDLKLKPQKIYFLMNSKVINLI